MTHDELIEIVEQWESLTRLIYRGDPPQRYVDAGKRIREIIIADAQSASSAGEKPARHTLDCDMVKHPNCTQCNCGSSVDTSTDTPRGMSRPSDGQKVIRDAASGSVRVPVEDPTRDGGGHPAGFQSDAPLQREADAGGVTSNAGAPGRGVCSPSTVEASK